MGNTISSSILKEKATCVVGIDGVRKTKEGIVTKTEC